MKTLKTVYDMFALGVGFCAIAMMLLALAYGLVEHLNSAGIAIGMILSVHTVVYGLMLAIEKLCQIAEEREEKKKQERWL